MSLISKARRPVRAPSPLHRLSSFLHSRRTLQLLRYAKCASDPEGWLSTNILVFALLIFQFRGPRRIRARPPRPISGALSALLGDIDARRPSRRPPPREILTDRFRNRAE